MPDTVAAALARLEAVVAGTAALDPADLRLGLDRLAVLERRLAYVSVHGGGFEQLVARGSKDHVLAIPPGPAAGTA